MTIVRSDPDSASGGLKGRRILITGGASGIGLACARLFTRDGACVAVLDIQQTDPGDCVFVRADLRDEAAVRAAVDHAAASLGGLDGLVNCAGIAQYQTLDKLELAVWRSILDVNLTGAMLATQAALPYLRANAAAAVINVASGLGLRPTPGQSAYAASKAAILALTKVWAQELGPAIRVNATCPGSTDTPLMQANIPAGTDMEQYVSKYVLRRQGTPEEQAQAIRFLIGPESSYITGVALAVDGGRTFH